MGGGKSGGDQKQTTTSEPWKPYQPFLKDFLGQAKQGYQSGGPEYAPWQTVAGFSPQQEQAFGRTEQRSYGSPTEGAMQGYLNQSLSGQLGADPSVLGFSLNNLGQIAGGGPNPWLDQTYNQASQRMNQSFNEGVVPGLQSMFGGAGRSNSGLQAQAFGQASRELGDQQNRLATNIYGGAYEQDAARRLTANQNLADIYATGQAERARSAQMVPSASALDWNNIDRLGAVGDRIQQQGQQYLTDQTNRFNFYQERPYQMLDRYQGWLGAGSGQGGTSQQKAGGGGGGWLSGAIGGALAGSKFGPWGAVGGGLLGALG